MVESFFATLKTELIHRHYWSTRAQARRAVFDFVEVFYNRQRLHSSPATSAPLSTSHQDPAAHDRSSGTISMSGKTGSANPHTRQEMRWQRLKYVWLLPSGLYGRK